MIRNDLSALRGGVRECCLPSICLATLETAMGESSFDDFMQGRRRVAQAYVNGDPEPLRAISASVDPATFFGPSGGVDQGAKSVLATNETGATHDMPTRWPENTGSRAAG
jgi:hypothetical protein